MIKKESKSINASVTLRVYEMLQALAKEGGYPSQSQAISGAIRIAYEKQFPRYAKHPTPLPVMEGMNAKQVVMKERVKAKEQEAQMKDAMIIENGKKVCTFLGGEPVGLSGPAKEAGCRAPRLSGSELVARAFPVPFVAMPVLLDDDILKDERASLWAFEQLFDMTLDEPNERIVTDQLEARVKGLLKGADNNLILSDDIHPAMLTMLAEKAEAYGVDTAEFRAKYNLTA